MKIYENDSIPVQQKVSNPLLFEYVRGKDIIGTVDCTEIAISRRHFAEAGADGFLREVKNTAAKILHQQVPLQADDMEFCNGEFVRSLTKEDVYDFMQAVDEVLG